MYPYSFDERVLAIDLIRLRQWFPNPSKFEEMKQRMGQTIDLVRSDPTIGGQLHRRLSGWRKLAWESGPIRKRDPWPDMRLVFRLHEGHIKIFAVGRRLPGDPSDVYRIAEHRQLTDE